MLETVFPHSHSIFSHKPFLESSPLVMQRSLLGCLMFLVQDAAALEEAEIRQSDGYSETSGRHPGNIFAAGE